jgi:hypothetical protein
MPCLGVPGDLDVSVSSSAAPPRLRAARARSRRDVVFRSRACRTRSHRAAARRPRPRCAPRRAAPGEQASNVPARCGREEVEQQVEAQEERCVTKERARRTASSARTVPLPSLAPTTAAPGRATTAAAAAPRPAAEQRRRRRAAVVGWRAGCQARRAQRGARAAQHRPRSRSSRRASSSSSSGAGAGSSSTWRRRWCQREKQAVKDLWFVVGGRERVVEAGAPRSS